MESVEHEDGGEYHVVWRDGGMVIEPTGERVTAAYEFYGHVCYFTANRIYRRAVADDAATEQSDSDRRER